MLCGSDATNWHRIPRRMFFYSVKVRGALVGDLFSESVLYHYSTKRGSHKRLMRRSGEGRGGRRAGSDELQPKRKTHCFSSTGWEEGNSQLCRHNTAMDVHVRCEVRSCCDGQAGEEQKETPPPPSPPGYLTAQDRITDSGGHGEGEGDDKKKPQPYLRRCRRTTPGIERCSGALFTKARINSDAMVMTAAHPRTPAGAALFFRAALSRFPFDSLFRSPPLSWHPNRPSGSEVSCGQSCGERLTLQD